MAIKISNTDDIIDSRDDDGTHFECLDASYPGEDFLAALDSED